MGRILVTGAAGFIGSHTVELLLSEGHVVLGLDNLRTGSLSNLAMVQRHPRFRFQKQDVLDRRRFFDRVKKFSPDAMIHLAAMVSVPESIAVPAANFRLNLEASFMVAEAARLHGVKRLVYASSAAVYGDARQLPLKETGLPRPISPYGAAKLASEALLLGYAASFNLTVCCLRYFNVYGPRQDPASPYSGVISIFAERFRKKKAVVIFGDGTQTRDFIFVRDVARANVQAAILAEAKTGAINICTGRRTSLLKLAQIFARHYPDAPAPIHSSPRLGDILHSIGANRKARSLLTFKPQWKVETGLAELIQHGIS